MTDFLFWVPLSFLLFYLLLWIYIYSRSFKIKDGSSGKDSVLPEISVLVAARNEEDNISACLQSLSELNYPPEKIEILIGDDDSSDSTNRLVQEFIKENSNFSLYKITSDLGLARAKANVLAHLARKAKGEILLVTDADVMVNKEWARELATVFEDKTGVSGGVTVTEPIGIKGEVQSLDWLYYFTLLKVFHPFVNITCVGNNMAISREAYESVGGYENIEFSVTEDYRLFKEIISRGYRFQYPYNRNSLNFTAPVEIGKWVSQRIRWIKGGRDLPLKLRMAIGAMGLSMPLLLILCLFQPVLGGLFFLVLFILKLLFLNQGARILGLNYSPFSLLLFPIYFLLSTMFSLIIRFIPTRVKWKGRHFFI